MRIGIILLFSLFYLNVLLASKPIEPKDVLTDEEIKTIYREENFFFRANLNVEGPIWNHLDRKYGHHYLKPRDEFYSMHDVIHRTLADGFPVQFKIQELYRADFARHTAFGQLLPRLSLTLGEGVSPININNFLTNLFGFILPHNWFGLIQAKMANEATRYLFIKTALDQYYAAELMYLELHQLIQDFEIRNFYFIHLQMLTDYLNGKDENNSTLAGTFSQLGTDMATNRGDIKLKFDDLAKVMALRVDSQGRFANDHINIKNVDDFPDRVKDLAEMGEFYNDKEKFIIEVLKKSVELKSIKEFYKIARLGVGVTASGSIFAATDSPLDNYVRLCITIGYDTLPKILTSVSNLKTAKINVQEQFVNMVDLARRAFDSSTNSIGGFTEAKRSMEKNRQAFAIHLDKILSEKEVNPLFLQDFRNLVDTELKLNNALHGTLKAHALMRRLLVIEEKDMNKFLPDDHEVSRAQRLFLADYPEYSRYGSRAEHVIHHIHHVKDLQKFLDGKIINIDNTQDEYDEKTVNELVVGNMPSLLHRRHFFHDKHRQFYKILWNYIEDQKIHMNLVEERKLKKRAGIHVDEIEFEEL